MRVILMHNPSAGREDHRTADLTDEITRAGHQVIAQARRREELAAALEAGCDLVAVAGGDGTVGKAAEVLVGREIPMAILPLGTANNIARSLGIRGSTAEQIAGWSRGRLIDLDAAVATLGDQPERFIEAFGFGAFPSVMERADAAPALVDVARTLDRDLGLLRASIAEAPLVHYEVIADGEELSGDYLLVEILNIPSIGPNVALIDRADHRDGRLDLVLAGRAEREALLAGIDRMRRGEPAGFGLRSRRVSELEVAGPWRRYHRDGDLGDDRTGSLHVIVEPAAHSVLV